MHGAIISAAAKNSFFIILGSSKVFAEHTILLIYLFVKASFSHHISDALRTGQGHFYDVLQRSTGS